MTKISKKSAYPIKNPVIGDFFVGTDSENNNKTVSFGFEYAANLINSIIKYTDYSIFNIEIDKSNPSFTTLVDSKVYFFSFEIKSNTTKTSDLENDGSDGIHPFITAEDLPEPIDISGKENKSDKGQADGYVPLNGFVKIASTYLDIVNDLVTGGANSLLSAEQGKQLQLQVSAINSILFSDNVNLDTVQEIVDAIESLQGYLDTILVNDLVTGGVTKALTAEMGKTLKGLIDALTTVVNNLQADVTNIDDRVTTLENYTPPPTTGLTGQAYAVWSGIGLKYYATWPGYYIEGVFKSAGNGEITLNPTTSMTAGQKRYDLIIYRF